MTLLFVSCLALGAIDDQPASEPEPQEPPKAPVLTKPPELLKFVDATYPEELLAQDLGGEALLFIDIDEKGLVERVEVQRATHPAFGEAAMVAASQFIFSPAEVDYAPSPIRIEYNYVFTPSLPVPDAVAGEVPPEKRPEDLPVNFTGLVREAGTREPIAQATILVNEVPFGVTAEDGTFALRGVPTGVIKVKVVAPAFLPYEREEELQEGQKLEGKFYLQRAQANPFETIVRSKAEQTEVTKVELSREEVSKVPGTFGDPVRVIENLPGLARVPGGLGGALIVRGAQPEDSAVFIDGVEVPLIYHFFGLTSVVNASFLENIDFYPGGFGARYGRATAGVVEVTSRDVTCNTTRGSLQVDVIDSDAYLCQPVGEWKGAAAARRSYVDAYLPFVFDQVQRNPDEGSITASPYYFDYQAKASRTFGKQKLDFFAFGANDRFRIIQSGATENVDVSFGLHQAFHRFQIRHRIKFSENTTLSTSLAPGYTLTEFSIASQDQSTRSFFNLPIWNLSWREDFAHKVNDQLTFKAGLDHIFGRATIGIRFPVPTQLKVFPSNTFDYTNVQDFSTDFENYSQGYWTEAVWQPLPNVKIVPGLRFERFDFYKTQGFLWMPRFAARWEIIPGTTLKGAYGWFQKYPEPQYLGENGNPNLTAERSYHHVIGVEHALTDIINIDVQGYYNDRSNLRAFSNRRIARDGQLINENWNNDGEGRAYGIEVLLRHLASPKSNFYGWLSYTLSKSVQRDHPVGTPGYTARQTDEYRIDFDQTHILTLVGQYKLPYGINVGGRFRYVTGNPFTPIDRGVKNLDTDTGQYGTYVADVPRNSDRYPAFHALDVGIDKTFTFDLWKLTLIAEVLNTYNRMNVEAFSYDYRYEERVPVSVLPIIPNLGIKGEF